MTAPRTGTCAYCGRAMWLAGLEPCCDKPEHADRLVCQDTHGCMAVVLREMHEAPGTRGRATLAELQLIRDALAYQRLVGDEVAAEQAGVYSALAAELGITAEAIGGPENVRQPAGPRRIADGTVLSAAELDTVLQALSDAIVYRTEQAATWCVACDEDTAECEHRSADLDRAGAYERLEAELGGRS